MKRRETTGKILKSALEKKLRQNPHLSMRQVAKKIGISPSFLSLIVNGKRQMPVNRARSICQVLDIDREKVDFIVMQELKGGKASRSVSLSSTVISPEKGTELKFIPKRLFWMLSQWYYLPVLNSTLLASYDGSPGWIARELGLELQTVEDALQRMWAAGLLEERQGQFVKTDAYQDFHSGAPDADIRKFHDKGMSIAQKELRAKTTPADLDQRLITSMIFSIAENDVPWMKQEIVSLMRRYLEKSSKSSRDKIYHLGVQLFPYSKN